MEDKTVVWIILIVVIVLIVTREFFCWYFKITEISNNLSSIANAISRAKESLHKSSTGLTQAL